MLLLRNGVNGLPRVSCTGLECSFTSTSRYIVATFVSILSMRNINEYVTEFKTSLQSGKGVSATKPTLSDTHQACQTCYDLFKNGQTRNGIYDIKIWDPNAERLRTISAYCDMQGGGYTVFQQRVSDETPFNRTWTEYEAGFGSIGENGSFWWGLESAHLLTTQCRDQALHIELGDCHGNTSYVHYPQVQVSDNSTSYRLSLATESATGPAGDGLCNPTFPAPGCPDGVPFSTFDRQHDFAGQRACSRRYGNGGWWYSSCANSQLNGVYEPGCPPTTFTGIYWLTWPGPIWSTDLAYTAMKIRPS